MSSLRGREKIVEIVEEMKEKDRGKGKIKDSDETEEIKTSPPPPLPAAIIAGLAQLLMIISFGQHGDIRYTKSLPHPTTPLSKGIKSYITWYNSQLYLSNFVGIPRGKWKKNNNSINCSFAWKPSYKMQQNYFFHLP